MIADLKPYEAYKDPGLPWLGDIPKHWEQQPLWTICDVRAERNPGNLPLLSVFLNRGVIRYEEGGGQVHAPSLDLSNYQVVRAGDFVLNNQQAWRGSVGVSRHAGIISPAYIVLSLSKRLESRFANYLMRSSSMVDQFVAASKGVGDIQRQVFWPFLRYVQVPLPSMEEQAAIVRFLGWSIGRLDWAIKSKRKVITLLNEQKQAIIHRAVTRGLDRSVPLKPSGIPWLGDIPQHWQITPNKYLLAEVESGSWGSDPGSDGIEASCIRGTDFDNSSLVARVDQAPLRLYAASEYRKKMLRYEDLILSTTGGSIAQATGAVVQYADTRPALPTNFAAKLSPKKDVNARFLTYVYYSMNKSKVTERLTNRVTISNLNLGAYLRVKVPVPPLTEQVDIASYLDQEVARFSQVISRFESEINLIENYQIRLVADVVTGKLDVRSAATQLPDEVLPGTNADAADLGEDLDIADEEATA